MNAGANPAKAPVAYLCVALVGTCAAILISYNGPYKRLEARAAGACLTKRNFANERERERERERTPPPISKFTFLQSSTRASRCARIWASRRSAARKPRPRHTSHTTLCAERASPTSDTTPSPPYNYPPACERSVGENLCRGRTVQRKTNLTQILSGPKHLSYTYLAYFP